MHNWPLRSFSQDYHLDSHVIHVVCINFICEKRDLQFNVGYERHFFLKFFMAILFAKFLPEIWYTNEARVQILGQASE